MHGRKKTSVELTEAERLAVTAKVATYRKLAEKLLEARHAVRTNPDNAIDQVSSGLLDSQAQLLTVNPDFSTLWNHRKELLLAKQILAAAAEEGGHNSRGTFSGEAGKKVVADATSVRRTMELTGRLGPCAYPTLPLKPADLEKELMVTAGAIRKQPKSYSAWHHRLWVVQGHVRNQGSDHDEMVAMESTLAWSYPSSVEVSALLAGELKLCGRMLELDQRNFHCWAYRLAVARMAGVSADDELTFTLEKITENFSNYSAYHYRSKVLERILSEGEGQQSRGELDLIGLLVSELDMVGQAAFTEPDDQSAWWYHRFLLDWGFRALVARAAACSASGTHDAHLRQGTTKSPMTADAAAYGRCLAGECVQLRELVEMEPESKWARTSLANTLVARLRYLNDATQPYAKGEASGEDEEDKEEEEEEGEEAAEVLLAEIEIELTMLIKIDPSRAGYYRHLMAQTKAGRSSGI